VQILKVTLTFVSRFIS